MLEESIKKKDEQNLILEKLIKSKHMEMCFSGPKDDNKDVQSKDISDGPHHPDVVTDKSN